MSDALLQVSDETIRLGMACGLMRLDDDGVHALTAEGETWLRAWTARKLAETRNPGLLPDEEGYVPESPQ